MCIMYLKYIYSRPQLKLKFFVTLVVPDERMLKAIRLLLKLY